MKYGYISDAKLYEEDKYSDIKMIRCGDCKYKGHKTYPSYIRRNRKCPYTSIETGDDWFCANFKKIEVKEQPKKGDDTGYYYTLCRDSVYRHEVKLGEIRGYYRQCHNANSNSYYTRVPLEEWVISGPGLFARTPDDQKAFQVFTNHYAKNRGILITIAIDKDPKKEIIGKVIQKIYKGENE